MFSFNETKLNRTIPLWESESDESSSSDENIKNRIVRNPRHFRTRIDHFNVWDDEEFFQRFRFTKDSFKELLDLLETSLKTQTERNHAIKPESQLLIVLRLLATGSMLVTAGDFGGIHKSSVHRIIKKVCGAISKLSNTFINIHPNDIRKNQTDFYKMAKFPKILGTIDCTHIKIQSPGGKHAEYFRNRKGYFSLNVQVVGDSNLYIKDIVARWPGSTHDQTIFSNSRICARLERGEFGNAIILGDSGYGLKKYLITPISNPLTPGEKLFNEAHIRTRNSIERLFGVWKRRFPILSLGLRLNLETSRNLILACAVLHNFALAKKEKEPPLDPNLNLVDDVEELFINNYQDDNTLRQPYINYFSNL